MKKTILFSFSASHRKTLNQHNLHKILAKNGSLNSMLLADVKKMCFLKLKFAWSCILNKILNGK